MIFRAYQNSSKVRRVIDILGVHSQKGLLPEQQIVQISYEWNASETKQAQNRYEELHIVTEI